MKTDLKTILDVFSFLSSLVPRKYIEVAINEVGNNKLCLGCFVAFVLLRCFVVFKLAKRICTCTYCY